MKTETRLVRLGSCPGDSNGANSTPIYQTATFAQRSATECGEYDYTRSGNPTRDVLEAQVAALEGAARTLSYTSGMAAIDAVFGLVRTGERVLAGSDLYGGSFRLLDRCLADRGIAVKLIDTTQPELVAAAIDERTRLLLVETPTNPLLQVSDLAALSTICRERGVLLAVDASLMSPLLLRPLERGADLVVHSATKHLSGHGDATAGIVSVNDEELAEELAFQRNARGTALAPFEAWLISRGVKTLGLRMERQQANARLVTERLRAEPAIRRVHYPGLADHPGAELHSRQARGPGSVFSFETGDAELSRRIVESCELFTIAVSFGSVASQISLPCRMSHASIPAAVRRLPEDLVRVSVGIEDGEDLARDLTHAVRRGQGRFAKTSFSPFASG